MKATIVNIGDELLIGQVVNTNAARMSQMLTAAGIEVVQTVVCGDNAEDIEACVARGLQAGNVVLMTGGLGPTKDDITKHTLCRLFGSELYENEAALDNVRSIFAKRGYELTDINRKQAWVPRCCTTIVNTVGTAPCMWFDSGKFASYDMDGKVLVSMPGVPFEMEHLMQTEVVPRLRAYFKMDAIVTKNILVQGIGESFLSDLIESWETSLPRNIRLAYLPVAGMVKLRLTAQGTDEVKLRKQVADAVERLYPIAKQYIVGEDAETLAELVAARFKDSGRTLAVAESCTGGSIVAGLTALAGASQYVKGGVVAYSNEVKMAVLGVKKETLEAHGAVSEDTVREMVEGVRQRLGADYAVATTGIAGPGGGTPDKPVGTVWVGLATPTMTFAKCMHYSGPRQQIINRTCNEAYAWLLREAKF